MTKAHIRVTALISALVALGLHALWPAIAMAATCSLHVWGGGSGVNFSDLNNNFSCINNALSSISDSNIASAAGIQYTKLQFPGLYPKAQASLGTTACTGASVSACAIAESVRVTSIYGVATGKYSVCLGYTAPNQNFAPIVNALTATANSQCRADMTNNVGGSQTCTGAFFTVDCEQPAGTLHDVPFAFVVMDDDNV